jgi:hypothetical protein
VSTPGGATEKLRKDQEEIAEREARGRCMRSSSHAWSKPTFEPPGMVEAETEMHIADLQRQLPQQAMHPAADQR